MTEEEYAPLFLIYERAYNVTIDRFESAGVGPRVTNEMAHQAGIEAIVDTIRKECLEDAKEKLQ